MHVEDNVAAAAIKSVYQPNTQPRRPHNAAEPRAHTCRQQAKAAPARIHPGCASTAGPRWSGRSWAVPAIVDGLALRHVVLIALGDPVHRIDWRRSATRQGMEALLSLAENVAMHSPRFVGTSSSRPPFARSTSRRLTSPRSGAQRGRPLCRKRSGSLRCLGAGSISAVDPTVQVVEHAPARDGRPERPQAIQRHLRDDRALFTVFQVAPERGGPVAGAPRGMTWNG